MNFSASVTRRDRKRRLQSGATVVQTRFIVNFRDPNSGKRKQLFFERHKEAVAVRDTLVASVATGAYVEMSPLTVAQAVEYWLENRRTEIKKGTWESYRQAATYIVGPLLQGTTHERHLYTRTGHLPAGTLLIELLGPKTITELTTADIRNWHRTLAFHVSGYTANVAKKFLRAALALAAEDFHLRVPPMPTQLGRGRSKPKKSILSPEQVGILLEAAQKDEERGIYYAFPFLTGVRPSEQLALLWEDVDLAAGVVRIRRMQERDGSITDITKTAASTREIPVAPLLATLLGKWRPACPVCGEGEPQRVFPSLGRTGSERHQSGRALSYANFRLCYWRPVFARLRLPYVSPHSARHTFISTLQAKGIEVGLVAKLAGHASITVTLNHYTQAVRGGDAAILALEKAFSS